jgi:iron complex transport system substrate-binding protein
VSFPLSRRHLLSASGLAVAAGVTACSSGGSSAEPAGPDTAVPGFPFQYEHVFGTTVVPNPATKVAVIGVTDADPLLALGLQPLTNTGFTFYPETGLGPWAADLLTGDLVKLGSDDEADVEQIAATGPDLVLALVSGLEEDLYEKLSAIAPVLARPVGSTAYVADRAESTLAIARAVGREARGEELVAAADAAFTDAIAAHPEFAGRTGVVALPYDGVYGVFTPGDGRGAFMSNLGFTLPEGLAALDTGDSFFIEVSRERLDLLDADVLVLLTDDSSRPQVDGDSVLQQLPVIQRGGLVLPNLDVRGAMTYNSVLSVPWGVERLVPDLASALS